MKVSVAQLCPTLWDPIDCSPPGPSVHAILQARTLEWVAISFFKRNYRKKVKLLSHLQATDIEHGPLECVFTRDEETGLSGAEGARDEAT